MNWGNLLLAGWAFTILGQEPNMTRVIGGKHILVYNDGEAGLTLPKSGQKETRLVLSGPNAKVRCLEMGLTAKGRAMEFRWAVADRPDVEKDADNKQDVEIRYIRIEGKAQVEMDSDAGYKAQLADAHTQHTAPPVEPLVASLSHAESDKFEYVGTLSHGTMTVPGPWTFEQTSHGTQEKKKDKTVTRVSFDQIVDFDGSKGQFDIGLDKEGKLGKPMNGVVSGPVHFKVLRHEKPEGSDKTTTTLYRGVADSVQFNLTTTPGTVTASGHVTLHAETEDGITDFQARELVLTVNDKYEPIDFRLLGSPDKPSGGTFTKAKDGSK